MMTANSRRLTLVGGNEFNRSAIEFVLPETFFNWLVRLSAIEMPTLSFVTKQEAAALADVIATVPRDYEQATMLGMFGDPDGEALKAFREFLIEGDFTICQGD